MKIIFTVLIILSGLNLHAQIADFEEYELPSESFLNGSDLLGGFTSGDMFFPNVYNSSYQFWTGFAVSNTTDIITPGSANQYSSYAGMGAKGSANYGVAYASGFQHVRLPENSPYPVSIYFSNNTYAALSMRDGDQFAKKFGGEDGNDPDFYFVTVRKWLDGELSTDSVSHYLADYRFDNSLDYISNSWEKVDLHSLGKADSLQFSVRSSDVGIFGINTPQYFCLDELIISSEPVNTEKIEILNLAVYPNPTDDFITISSDEILVVELHASNGQIVELKTGKQVQFDIREKPAGIYYATIKSAKTTITKKIITY